MDPLTTPLTLALGSLAGKIISSACEKHLQGKLTSLFGWLESLGEDRDAVEAAIRDVMEQSLVACLEMLVLNIQSHGYSEEEITEYRPALEAFVNDAAVAEELMRSVREPNRDDLPSSDLLRARWEAIPGKELPDPSLWRPVANAFRRQAKKRMKVSAELRDLLNAQNLDQIRDLLAQQGGVPVQVRLDQYAKRMRTRFAPVDLANLMPAYADDPGRMVLRDVFVPQSVRENPPPVEIPKDLVERLGADDFSRETLDERQFERLRATYVDQAPRPVLDVFSAPRYRRLVLTGDPGSGKSTLLRYLLTGILEPPKDPTLGEPLAWTTAFEKAFPLLIELRDFYALRRDGKCESFLEYVSLMGKTDQWYLDDRAVDSHLERGPALVMLDGLDEIFNGADRERVMHEIAGFAQRYPNARIVVTSRPVGYKEQILRNADFSHFGLQDLDDDQIEAFVRGWFTLTFPREPRQAELRIERVLGSVRRSKSIRLLAGNPMLLTIMALLGREEELPRERAKFYEKAVEVLCHHWDANRNLQLPEDRYLNADDKKDLLRRIAIRMQEGEGGLQGNAILELDLEDEIRRFLTEEDWQSDPAEAKQAARRMIRQLRERNYILCLRGPKLYGFVHRTFLEYLTAAEYVRRFDRQPQQLTLDELLELFSEHCADDEWREVLRLICGQIDVRHLSKIIDFLTQQAELAEWREKETIPRVSLSILCLSETKTYSQVEPHTGSKLLAAALFLILKGVLNTAVIEAVLTIGRRWPGKQFVEFRNKLPKPSRVDRYWPRLVSSIFEDRSEVENLARGADQSLRSAAIPVLIDVWPDYRTRNLLLKSATHNSQYTRRAALRALAKIWPDEEIRELVENRATQDKNQYVRSAALEALAEISPNEKTRELIQERAVRDKLEHPRWGALGALAKVWPDEKTRELIQERAVMDEHYYVRLKSLVALGRIWPDEKSRELIQEQAVKDESQDTRSAALEELAKVWPNERTYDLAQEQAVQDEDQDARRSALKTLVTIRLDEKTRALLQERAALDEHQGPRLTALEALAKIWPDEKARELIQERVVREEDDFTRSEALQTLVKTWPDERTRELIQNRAAQDENSGVRSEALRMLAKIWPDKKTREQIQDRAVLDEDRWCRRVALKTLAEVFSKKHSEFGRLVFTRDLDGIGPYLDPTQPIPRGHIENAAEQASIPAEKIDETVTSLSKHIGWDITKGSDHKLEP